MANRWIMNKLGFVNFWLYDAEEFQLENGCILLRGSNGSGKSITTQSFIPFLLDGNKSPERLDPFGSRDRKMAFYLLGDDEREESTGYLYLEFKKESLEEYLTIGVGMRAQKGKDIDFWGFCLCDGRRIGLGDVALYEKMGDKLLPLSKQRLKHLLNDNAHWADSPKEYKELVNDQVFHFRDVAQYEQLIQLLIKVRAPKLSKDFRPSQVKRLLNESLQVLSNEDLSAIAATMDRMDFYEANLKDCRASLRDATIIRNEYTRYNQYILGKKGQAYLIQKGKTLKLQNQLRSQKAELESRKEEHQHQKELLTQADTALTLAKTQRAALGDDDITAKQEQLAALQARHKEQEEQLQINQRALENKSSRIDGKEVELRNVENQRANEDGALRVIVKEMKKVNTILQFGEAHEQYLLNVGNVNIQPTQGAMLASLKQLKKQMHSVLENMEKVKRVQSEYDDVCERLDHAATECALGDRELHDARQQEQEERDGLLEALTRCVSNNEELLFSSDDSQKLRRCVLDYHGPADWNSLMQVINSRHQACAAQLNKELFMAHNKLEQCQQTTAEIKQRWDLLQSQTELPPPRRQRYCDTRAYLTARGIPYKAFYEAVDFEDALPPEARNLLEAQLIDAGWLDALLVPEEYRGKLTALRKECPERFLQPSTPVSSPVTGLIPEQGTPFTQMVQDILQGISASDPDAQNALLPDGRFCSGAIHGLSVPVEAAQYIGVATRLLHRQRQIEECKQQLEEAKKSENAVEDEVVQLKRRMAKLEDELLSMPLSGNLDQALEMLKNAQRRVDLGKQAYDRVADEKNNKNLQLSGLRMELNGFCTGMPYERSLEAYEEALQAAEEYENLVSQSFDAWNRLVRIQIDINYTINMIDELRDGAAKLKQGMEHSSRELAVAAGQMEELQRFLERPENQQRTARIRALNDEIREQENARQSANDQCIRLMGELERFEQDIATQEKDFLLSCSLENEYERYFVEDLDLDCFPFSRNEEETVSDLATRAVGKIQPIDRERTHELISESLRNNYQQHNNTLLKYQPRMELCLDAPDTPGCLRQRLIITLQREGKALTLYQFISLLENDVLQLETLLEQQDRELFENILSDTISHKLRARIEESRQWSDSMSDLMKSMDTSMGLSFSLEWTPKKAENEGEMNTAKLVSFLNRDRALLTREDSQAVSTHFRAKIKAARQNAELNAQTQNYNDLIRTALDYREWYEFRLYYQREGEVKRELTDPVFNKFSGGEKAMSIYAPQFAAVSAQYQKASPQCPLLLALDEAFAGVDDKNIEAMFRLVHTLHFGYIMNSQALWGCYACVASLNIAEFHRYANAQVVTILHYRWNGKQIALQEG
ncbi:MAG: TIGR02680 family protein [Eubacteriales bacterium]|nr:TIGR02680 family protein [Eubacteriales bacterium]